MKQTLNIIWNKLIYFVKFYFLFFNKGINASTIKKIDLCNFKVFLYIKGTRSNISYKLDEIIYDFAIISSLTSEEASYLGYYYGCNYEQMNLHKRQNYDFLITPTTANKYNVLAVDRRKNIIFSSCSDRAKNNVSMKPEEIFKSKAIINGFHPTNACYIGLLAGLSTRSQK